MEWMLNLWLFFAWLMAQSGQPAMYLGMIADGESCYVRTPWTASLPATTEPPPCFYIK